VLKVEPTLRRDEYSEGTNVRSASTYWESGMETNLSERTMMDGCLSTAPRDLKEAEEAGRNRGSI